MTEIDQMGSMVASAGSISSGRGVSASPLWRQAPFSWKNKHASPYTIAKRERADKQNTSYLGFEQQIIPGHLSDGIQVRTDVSCIPHFHLPGGVFLGQDSSFQLHVRFALTDC